MPEDLYMQGVTPCAHSEQCVLQLEALDDCSASFVGWGPAESGRRQQRQEKGGVQEANEVERLCEHLKTCLACTLAVTEARGVRRRQQQALQLWLSEQEERTVSTLPQVFALIEQERRRRDNDSTNPEGKDLLS